MGAKTIPFKKRNHNDQALTDLLQSLDRTRCEIEQAYNHFNFASDPDLVESYVYEITSLQCRYNYLLRQVKAHGAAAAMAPLHGKEL